MVAGSQYILTSSFLCDFHNDSNFRFLHLQGIFLNEELNDNTNLTEERIANAMPTLIPFNKRRRSIWPVLLIIIILLAVLGILLNEKGMPGTNRTISKLQTSVGNKLLLNSNKTAMDDPVLVDIVKEQWLFPPSNHPYNLSDPKNMDYSQDNVASTFLFEKIGPRRNGFFIECGAADGATFSNTLYFETNLGWTGLLIESNPLFFSSLLSKHRKAYSIEACLSVTRHPEKVRFQNADLLSGIEKAISVNHQRRIDREKSRGSVVSAQCFPLYTILLALDLPTIDLFSLDVEGAEAAILRTIPFDKVKINFIYVEHNHVQKAKKEIHEILTSNGFEYAGDFKYNSFYKNKAIN